MNSAFRWFHLSFSPLPFTSPLSQLFVRPPQTTTLPFCISFSWEWFWSLPPVQCYEPPSTVLQALSIRSNPLNVCHIHCIIIKDLIQVIPEWLSVFAYFLQYKSEFYNKDFVIWTTVSFQSYFSDCIELLQFQLQRMQSIWFWYWASSDFHV